MENIQPKTHDYTIPNWGHDFVTMEIKDGGIDLDLVGFGRGISKGDFLIFAQKDGSTTRYEVKSIEYKLDPPDMWSMVATFAPRPYAEIDITTQGIDT